MQLQDMYQEIILDHYRNPHHKGLRDPFDAQVYHVNPTCGDEVTLRVALKGTGGEAVIEDVSFDSLGCSISQASASVMTDLVIGKPVGERWQAASSVDEDRHPRCFGQGKRRQSADMTSEEALTLIELACDTRWRADSRMMYGRRVLVPRETAGRAPAHRWRPRCWPHRSRLQSRQPKQP